tara:strand:+ start:2547 stop:3368 length:822 start_codon:yes stop_codon:yes gene_type:complete
MAKLKHNKRRNTAFLFEALVKELTKATIKEDKGRRKKIVAILQEFFKKNTILSQELELYKTICESRNLGAQQAEKILAEVKRVYSTLDRGSAFAAQSQLISKINKNVGPNVFDNFVPNYKSIASIAQLFDKKNTIKNRVLMETRILDYMTSRKVEQKQNEMKLSNTELKMFSKNFNSTYGGLLEEQKKLLSKYISSFDDNGLELKVYLNEEIARLREIVEESLNMDEVKNDSSMVEKTKNILKTLDGFKGQFISEGVLKKVLKIQDLAKEITT